MTAVILPFHAEMELPPVTLPGNSELVTVLSDFPSDADGSSWATLVAQEAAQTHGDFTAQAIARLAALPANVASATDDGGATVLLRCVAAVQRPSGRVARVVLAHLTLRAEYCQTPEGDYVDLRVGSPVVHTAGLDDKTEVLEVALAQLLEQTEMAAGALVDMVRQASTDCVVWTLPLRSGGAIWLQELNVRLVNRFFGGSTPRQLAMAA